MKWNQDMFLARTHSNTAILVAVGFLSVEEEIWMIIFSGTLSNTMEPEMVKFLILSTR